MNGHKHKHNLNISFMLRDSATNPYQYLKHKIHFFYLTTKEIPTNFK